MLRRILAIAAVTAMLAVPAFAQVPGGGGGSGSGMKTNGSNATSAALDAIATAAGQTGGLKTTDSPTFNVPQVNTLHIFGSSTGYASLVYNGAGAVNTLLGIPQVGGTPNVVTTGDTGTVTGTMLATAYLPLGGGALTGAMTTSSTINKLTLTAPASGATLTIADGKTLTDTSAIGAALLKGATGGGFAAATAADIPAPSTTAGSGSSLVFVAPAGYVFCTTTCTVTPPVPAVGYQFCVFNDPGVSAVITVGGNTSVFYEKSDGTAYGTSGGHLTSGGANLDEMCIIGRDTTHYTIGAQHGAWTAS